MTKDQFQPIRGTKDVIGLDTLYYKSIILKAEEIAARYCYNSIFTPIFEKTSVFHRTLGEASDVVTKETYTFLDRDKTSITLRPEFTAAIVRAIISNGLTQSLPLRFFSHGPVFRHERPQHCRYRQFHQLNFESFGYSHPQSDAEMIMLAYDLLKALKIEQMIKLEINTVGDLDSRNSYIKALVDYLLRYKDQLSSESIKRLEINPLRILDSKDENDKKILKNAPTIIEYLSVDAKNYYDSVLKYLDILGVQYTQNNHLVRGLDYYTHTVFEFTTEALGSQGTVLAGGRYNGLVAMMGGPNIPAIGFAAGIERLLELHKQFSDIQKSRPIHVLPIGVEAEELALKIVHELRNHGLKIYLDYNANLKKRMNYANKVFASAVIIFGEEEMKQNVCVVKNMLNGEQHTVNIQSLFEFLSAF